MTGQDTEIQWYIARDGKQHGPLTEVEMRTFVAHSYLRASDLIWRPGLAEWQAATLVFPEAFEPGLRQPAQPPRPTYQAPQAPAQTQAAPAHLSRAAARVEHTATRSDFDAANAPRRGGSRVKRLTFATIAITVVGGGAIALATYRQPLMELVSGSSDASTTSDSQAPVVAAPDDGKVAEASSATQPQDNAQTGASAQAMPPSATSGGDVIPPPAQSTPEPEPQPTTTASVSATPTADPQQASGTQVAAVDTKPPPPPPPPSVDGSSTDARLQKIPVWVLIKKEYPDWYSAQVTAAEKLITGKKPDSDVAMLLAQGLVNLRRQNAEKALSASSEKLQNVAVAFLAHLKALRAQSVSACFGFISKGETSPAVVQMMENPESATALNAQADAIFEAISEGSKNPVKHDAAVKSDYDMLIKELGKLGWKEEDLQVFSNPKLLAKREPEQVCKMVQEWFIAHLSVPDKSVRDRLLYETLKPVVSG